MIYALIKAMDKGHCGLSKDTNLGTGAERLMGALAFELVEEMVVADAVAERRCVFLAGLCHTERDIAERLRTFAAGEPPWPAIDVERAVPWLEARGSLTVAPS